MNFNFSELGYTHEWVNHSVNFRDPVTGAHTNEIESTWMLAKRFFRHLTGTRSTFKVS